MPSGRAATIERMQAMLGQTSPAPIRVLSPEEALVEDMQLRHGARLHHAEIRADRLLMILDADAPLIAAEQTRLAEAAATPRVEMIDRVAWETLQRLAQAGILQLASTSARILHRAGLDVGADADLHMVEPAAHAA
jgi:hypothetical protein